MGKLSAFKNLLYALARIPGLGFLRGAASTAAQAERTARNVGNVKKAAEKLKGEEKKEPEGASEEKKEE